MGLKKILSMGEYVKWLLLILFLALYYFPFYIASGEYTGIAVWIGCYLIYTPLTVLVFSRWGKMQPKDIGLTLSIGKVSLSYWLIVLSVLVGFAVLALNVTHAFNLHVRVYTDIPNWTYYFSYFYCPLPEEIIFRGILCTIVASRAGWLVAILTSGVLFGLLHIYAPAPYEGLWFVPFIGGFFLAWVFYKTRTLVMPIIWHLGANTLCILMAHYPQMWEGFVRMVTVGH